MAQWIELPVGCAPPRASQPLTVGRSEGAAQGSRRMPTNRRSDAGSRSDVPVPRVKKPIAVPAAFHVCCCSDARSSLTQKSRGGVCGPFVGEGARGYLLPGTEVMDAYLKPRTLGGRK